LAGKIKNNNWFTQNRKKLNTTAKDFALFPVIIPDVYILMQIISPLEANEIFLVLQ